MLWVYITSLLLGCAHSGSTPFIFSCCPLLAFQLFASPMPRREIHGGVLARTPKFLSPPSRWLQLWVLAWENSSEKLEPAVPATAVRAPGSSAGSSSSAALPRGWKAPFGLLTRTTTVSSSLGLSVCFTVWRAPLLMKLCQFVSAKLLAPRVDWLIANYLSEKIGGGS